MDVYTKQSDAPDNPQYPLPSHRGGGRGGASNCKPQPNANLDDETNQNQPKANGGAPLPEMHYSSKVLTVDLRTSQVVTAGAIESYLAVVDFNNQSGDLIVRKASCDRNGRCDTTVGQLLRIKLSTVESFRPIAENATFRNPAVVYLEKALGIKAFSEGGQAIRHLGGTNYLACKASSCSVVSVTPAAPAPTAVTFRHASIVRETPITGIFNELIIIDVGDKFFMSDAKSYGFLLRGTSNQEPPPPQLKPWP